MQRILWMVMAVFLFLSTGCGGGSGGSSGSNSISSPVHLSVAPATGLLGVGGTQTFIATVMLLSQNVIDIA